MDFFIRYFSGFFIQIFFSLLLLYIPFPKESYRFPKRKSMILLGAVAFAEAVIFSFMMHGERVQSFPTLYMAANLFMLVSVVILVAMWAWAVRETLIKKLIVVSFALFYAASQYILINFFTKTYEEIYSLKVVLLYAVSALIMFPAFSFILHKTVRPYLEQIEPKKMKHEFYMILFMTAFYILEMLLIFSSPLSSIEPYWGYVFFSFLLIVTLLCVFYCFLFRESLRRKAEEEKDRQYEIQKFEYNRITAKMESEQRMRHDFRHHIRILSDMAEQNNSEAIKKYLGALSDETHRLQSEKYCENGMVNGILHYYIGCAHDYGIACTVSANCNSDLPVKSTDMTVLLGNTLENAIHSCNEASTKKWIAVKIGIVGGSLVIVADNTCDRVELRDKHICSDRFLPASAFKSIHKNGGYGLDSITLAAARYDGDASFRFDAEKHIFTTMIRLNIN